MSRLALIALAYAAQLGLQGAAAAAERSAAHDFCAMQWASEPAMLNQCVSRQIAGAQSVVRYLDWAKASPGPDGQHVVDTFELCRSKWAPDYYLVDNCLRARALIAPPK